MQVLHKQNQARGVIICFLLLVACPVFIYYHSHMPSAMLKASPPARKEVGLARTIPRFHSDVADIPETCDGVDNMEYDGDEVLKWGSQNSKV